MLLSASNLHINKMHLSSIDKVIVKGAKHRNFVKQSILFYIF